MKSFRNLNPILENYCYQKNGQKEEIYDSIDIKDIVKDYNIHIIIDNQTTTLENNYDVFKWS